LLFTEGPAGHNTSNTLSWFNLLHIVIMAVDLVLLLWVISRDVVIVFFKSYPKIVFQNPMQI